MRMNYDGYLPESETKDLQVKNDIVCLKRLRSIKIIYCNNSILIKEKLY